MTFEVKPYEKRQTTKRLAIFDSETDPFRDGREVLHPFTCGFLELDTGEYVDFWGADCFGQFLAWLRNQTDAGQRFIIYCHNFGGFDAHLGLLDHLDPGTSPTIIGGRIASCSIMGQEFRDSYRLFPEALADYAKDKFDYDKMEADCREQYRDEILVYQRHDCEYLGDLIREFFNLFGDRPTIGNTAIDYMQSFHGIERMRLSQDTQVRPFFFGGRNQAFLVGVHEPRPGRRWRCYDVNRMYAWAMRNVSHPVSADMIIGQRIWPTTAFVEWEGENAGCAASRADDGSLDFRVTSGKFFSTIHEFHLGEETGTIKPRRIIRTIGFHDWSNFAEFIDFCEAQEAEAKATGDKIRRLFWKRLKNSAYGKFAQDPRNYERYCYSKGADGIPEFLAGPDTSPYGFTPRFVADDRIIWGRPSPSRHSGYYNVACGASITGAARGKLFQAILAADRPAYCDTDSIVCEALSGSTVNLSDTDLGAWKLEASGDLWVCGGKKLYALLSSDPADRLDERGDARERVPYNGRDYWCVKKASKGARLVAQEILKVALGGRVRYKSDRPNFKLDGSVEFIDRLIERTD